MKFRSLIAGLAFSLAGALPGAVFAAQAQCPEAGGVYNVVTLEDSAGCFAYGNGNINGNTNGSGQDPILISGTSTNGNNTFNKGNAWYSISGLTLLDKSDQSGDLLDGVLTGKTGGLAGGVSGDTITVGNVNGFSNFILAMKFGTGNEDYEWVAFLISGPGTYTFTNTGNNGGGLSHTNLYGARCAPTDPTCDYGDLNQVPVPASLPLLAGGLVLAGFVARRKSRKA